MSEEEPVEEEAPKKKGGMMTIVSLVLGLALGGGAFFAIYSGMILGPPTAAASTPKKSDDEAPLTFLPIEPLTISLGPRAETLLRFTGQLEVDPAYVDDVTKLMPRVLDVMNGYLRAVDVSELEDPASLIRFRAQLLRRVQLVTGPGQVRDLLITEFVFR